MAAEYTVRINGKKHGPFTGAQLKALADKGQLTEDAEVREGDDGPWHSAGKVKGLFGTVSPSTISTSKSGVGKKPKKKPKKRPKKKPKKKPKKVDDKPADKPDPFANPRGMGRGGVDVVDVAPG